MGSSLGSKGGPRASWPVASGGRNPAPRPAAPGVPASRAGVPELRGLCRVPELPGPLLRLVCRRGAVSTGVWGPPPTLGPWGGHGYALGPTGTGTEAVPRSCRCTRRAKCPRAEESGHWLWSREESCVAVTGAQPQNMSRRARGKVRGKGRCCPSCGDGQETLGVSLLAWALCAEPKHGEPVLCGVPLPPVDPGPACLGCGGDHVGPVLGTVGIRSSGGSMSLSTSALVGCPR